MQWTSCLLNSIRNFRLRLIRQFLHFFYPNRCPVCDTVITAHELLCSTCSDTVLIGQDDYCRSCGKVACMCKKKQLAYDRAAVCSAYADGTVAAIIKLKNSTNTNFAVFAAQILTARLQYGYYHNIDCVMPVPMHSSKKRTRGYNQAALIGREVARLLEIPYREDVLTKQRSKQEQHKLSLEERAKNVDTFGIRNCDLTGMRILLCDDVLTTGNTMNRCAELLKEKGAAAVIAAAAATTIPKKQEETK